MESLLAWLAHYGYPGLFVLLMLGIAGLPIPDETLLVFCGYLIFRGRLQFPLTFIFGFAGSLCGISLSYFLGRRYGLRVISRFAGNSYLESTSRWFHRIGYWLLTICYFVPGVRHFAALVAGMSLLPFRTFALYAYPGAAVWVATFLTVGYIFGESWQHTSEQVHRYSLILTAIAAVALAIFWFVNRKRLRLK